MLATEGNLHRLAGGLRVKARVQHPQVKVRKDRKDQPWVFRYWSDEVQPDGTVKTLRKYQVAGLSKGENAITKKQAEVERDNFLAKLNAPTVEAAVEQVAATGVALFGEVANLYESGYLARRDQISTPTRKKETFYLKEYILPKWGALRLNQLQPQAVEDWMHTAFGCYWTRHGVRAMMIRIYNYAEGHGLWEEAPAVSRRIPVSCWMRLSGQPSRPSAMTCCRFSSLKTLLTSMEGTPSIVLNVLPVSIGRFSAVPHWPLLGVPRRCKRSRVQISAARPKFLKGLRTAVRSKCPFWRPSGVQTPDSRHRSTTSLAAIHFSSPNSLGFLSLDKT